MLAVIAPTVDIVDRPVEAGLQPPSTVESAAFNPAVALNKRLDKRPERASRGVARRVTPTRPHRPKVVVRATSVQLKRVVRRPVKARVPILERRRLEGRSLEHRGLERRGEARHERRRSVERRFSRAPAAGLPRGGMGAVIDFARAQIGKSYGSGGEGPGYFDCSGLTMRAYARAGILLPHSSDAQAARARMISRDEARAGDLVVGPGHVGIYMGGGMMIDAGNSRVGVVFREMYGGLHIERL